MNIHPFHSIPFHSGVFLSIPFHSCANQSVSLLFWLPFLCFVFSKNHFLTIISRLFRCAKGYAGDPTKPGQKCVKLPGKISIEIECNLKELSTQKTIRVLIGQYQCTTFIFFLRRVITSASWLVRSCGRNINAGMETNGTEFNGKMLWEEMLPSGKNLIVPVS